MVARGWNLGGVMSVSDDEERAAMAKYLLAELIESFKRSGADGAPWSMEVVPTLEWLLRALVAKYGPDAIDGNSFEYWRRKRASVQDV